MSDAPAQRVYLDTNIFIYAVEGITALERTITRLFERIGADELASVTSELTLAEVLVKPLREARAGVVAAYERILRTSAGFQVEPVSRPAAA